MDRLIKTRAGFKNVRESEKKILYFLKNKVNSILDIGCGTGLVFDWIKKNYTKCAYFGVDIDKNLVKYAQKKYNEKFIAAVCENKSTCGLNENFNCFPYLNLTACLFCSIILTPL